jgi:hypothetical protein
MNPLDPEEPAALVQFALVLLFGLAFTTVLFGFCH